MPELGCVATVGLSFREAPGSVRARLASGLDADLLARLQAQGVTGLVSIQTCARSLWVLSAANPAWPAVLIQGWVAEKTGVLPALRVGRPALRTLLRVAYGLDSHIQGEIDVGRQVLAAFTEAARADLLDADLQRTRQALVSLLAQGEAAGHRRNARSLGAHTANLLVERGLAADMEIAVVGAGAIGQQVVAGLRRAGWTPRIYNRSPQPDCGTLADLVQAAPEIVVLCTAAPTGWFVPSPETRILVDLGLPSQHAPGVVPTWTLETLWAGEGEAMGEPEVVAAEEAVERRLSELVRALQRRTLPLDEVRQARLDFEATEIQLILTELSPSSVDLPALEQVAVQVVRRFSHSVTARLRAREESP